MEIKYKELKIEGTEYLWCMDVDALSRKLAEIIKEHHPYSVYLQVEQPLKVMVEDGIEMSKADGATHGGD